MPTGFYMLIAAQFVSALADNALLILAAALLQEQGFAPWWVPLLKFSFTISYVLLAPFMGPLADAVPKTRLMVWMNGLKILGVLLLFSAMHPVLAYAVAGIGAAAYAPAKYGLITEWVPPRLLVQANGWIEISVVMAALAGVVLGGVLVSAWFANIAWVAQMGVGFASILHGMGSPLVSHLLAPLGLMALLYGLAALLQLKVPACEVEYPQPKSFQVAALIRDFAAANGRLWRDPDGGLTLTVTTLFWGVGATVQFAVLRWAKEVLDLPLDGAAYLQAAVAIGVVLGAGLAGSLVNLGAAWRVLPAGVVLGLMIAGAALTRSLSTSLPALTLLGVVGGVLVVPMNALLQHRGHQLLTAGRSIAVQGFNENLSILVMLGAYAACLALDWSIVPVLVGLGAWVALAMAVIIWAHARQHRKPVV
jgi:MFS family permease